MSYGTSEGAGSAAYLDEQGIWKEMQNILKLDQNSDSSEAAPGDGFPDLPDTQGGEDGFGDDGDFSNLQSDSDSLHLAHSSTVVQIAVLLLFTHHYVKNTIGSEVSQGLLSAGVILKL